MSTEITVFNVQITKSLEKPVRISLKFIKISNSLFGIISWNV